MYILNIDSIYHIFLNCQAFTNLFLIFPIMLPICTALGLSPTVVIFTYCIADGFTDMILPTNPVLLVGLSMAKAYDSQSESNSTITASLLNIMYMMIFFAANGHATLMQIFVELAKALPYDEFVINISSFEVVIRLNLS